MRTLLSALIILFLAQPTLAKENKARKLNPYCDPVGTEYKTGSPLVNEITGKKMSLEEYLKNKGFDLNCNKIDKRAALKLNEFCDPEGTMYAGGNPLFDEATGKNLELFEYLRRKGLDTNCQPLKDTKDKNLELINKEQSEEF